MATSLLSDRRQTSPYVLQLSMAASPSPHAPGVATAAASAPSTCCCGAANCSDGSCCDASNSAGSAAESQYNFHFFMMRRSWESTRDVVAALRARLSSLSYSPSPFDSPATSASLPSLAAAAAGSPASSSSSSPSVPSMLRTAASLKSLPSSSAAGASPGAALPVASESGSFTAEDGTEVARSLALFARNIVRELVQLMAAVPRERANVALQVDLAEECLTLYRRSVLSTIEAIRGFSEDTASLSASEALRMELSGLLRRVQSVMVAARYLILLLSSGHESVPAPTGGAAVDTSFFGPFNDALESINVLLSPDHSALGSEAAARAANSANCKSAVLALRILCDVVHSHRSISSSGAVAELVGRVTAQMRTVVNRSFEVLMEKPAERLAALSPVGRELVQLVLELLLQFEEAVVVGSGLLPPRGLDSTRSGSSTSLTLCDSGESRTATPQEHERPRASAKVAAASSVVELLGDRLPWFRDLWHLESALRRQDLLGEIEGAIRSVALAQERKNAAPPAGGAPERVANESPVEFEDVRTQRRSKLRTVGKSSNSGMRQEPEVVDGDGGGHQHQPPKHADGKPANGKPANGRSAAAEPPPGAVSGAATSVPVITAAGRLLAMDRMLKRQSSIKKVLETVSSSDDSFSEDESHSGDMVSHRHLPLSVEESERPRSGSSSTEDLDSVIEMKNFINWRKTVDLSKNSLQASLAMRQKLRRRVALDSSATFVQRAVAEEVGARLRDLVLPSTYTSEALSAQLWEGLQIALVAANLYLRDVEGFGLQGDMLCSFRLYTHSLSYLFEDAKVRMNAVGVSLHPDLQKHFAAAARTAADTVGHADEVALNSAARNVSMYASLCSNVDRQTNNFASDCRSIAVQLRASYCALLGALEDPGSIKAGRGLTRRSSVHAGSSATSLLSMSSSSALSASSTGGGSGSSSSTDSAQNKKRRPSQSSLISELSMRVSLIGAQALLLATRLLNALQALLNSVETLKHLQQNPPFDTTDLFTSNSDAVKANVWDYQAYVDAAASSSTRVASATLLELVALMTDSKPADSEFSDAFLLTCHDVSSPDEILSLLMARFHAVGLPAGFDEERLLRVRRRVLSVLMRWVGLKWKDLSEGTMIKVYGFLDSVERGKEYAELAQLLIDLRAELDRTLALRQAMERDHANSLLRQPVLSLNALVPLQFFLSTPETVLAEQMTLLDFEHYCAIQSSELLHQSWVNPEQRIECLGISAMFERLNSLGHWVASMALLHDRKKARAALLSKVIRVGEALLALNNFNSLAGFVAGCCMAPVDRLRHSWKYVPKRDRELLGQFTQLLGPAKSYSAYRGAVLARNPPICPYIGVYLSDLTLIDEGNPNLVDGGRINWQKRELESRVIGELLVYQNVPYSSLQSNPAVAQYLISLPCLPVAVLQELSLAYEPRGAESSDVL